MSIKFIEPEMNGANLHIGIVTARFNEWACNGILQACLARLSELGVRDENITVVTVPGALEVPFGLDSLNTREEYDAFIAIGCVIRGETYHFELVSNESARAISEFIADEGVSVANCILTVENEEQAKARIEEKARDAANVAVEMGNLRRQTLNLVSGPYVGN